MGNSKSDLQMHDMKTFCANRHSVAPLISEILGLSAFVRFLTTVRD